MLIAAVHKPGPLAGRGAASGQQVRAHSPPCLVGELTWRCGVVCLLPKRAFWREDGFGLGLAQGLAAALSSADETAMPRER